MEVMEDGGANFKGLNKEMRHGRTAHNMSSSSLRKKSDLTLVSKISSGLLKEVLVNIQEVILGTKLSILFPAVPIAIVAQCYGVAKVSSLLIYFSILIPFLTLEFLLRYYLIILNCYHMCK